jgi:hypothetical protein
LPGCRLTGRRFPEGDRLTLRSIGPGPLRRRLRLGGFRPRLGAFYLFPKNSS